MASSPFRTNRRPTDDNGSPLSTADCRLLIVDCRLLIVDRRLLIVDRRLLIVDCRLSIVDCRLLIETGLLFASMCRRGKQYVSAGDVLRHRTFAPWSTQS